MSANANSAPALAVSLSHREVVGERALAQSRHERLVASRQSLARRQTELIARGRALGQEIKRLAATEKSWKAQEDDAATAGLAARAKARRLAVRARLIALKAKRAQGLEQLALVGEHLRQLTEMMRSSRRRLAALTAKAGVAPGGQGAGNGAGQGSLVATLKASSSYSAQACAPARKAERALAV